MCLSDTGNNNKNIPIRVYTRDINNAIGWSQLGGDISLNITDTYYISLFTMKAYIFPGQGSQRPGMAKELLAIAPYSAQEYLEMADDILGFELSKIMIDGTADELRQTSITQPAVYVYSVIKARISRDFKPDMVAGHSLGEFSALAAIRGVTFAEGLRIVHKRALAMQAACDAQPSSMAAVLGIDNEIIEKICSQITEEIVVPANYNCPGQLVISGTKAGLALAKKTINGRWCKKSIAFKRKWCISFSCYGAGKSRIGRSSQ